MTETFEELVREALSPPERFCADVHRGMDPRCHACTTWMAREEYADDLAPKVAAAIRGYGTEMDRAAPWALAYAHGMRLTEAQAAEIRATAENAALRALTGDTE